VFVDLSSFDIFDKMAGHTQTDTFPCSPPSSDPRLMDQSQQIKPDERL